MHTSFSSILYAFVKLSLFPSQFIVTKCRFRFAIIPHLLFPIRFPHFWSLLKPFIDFVDKILFEFNILNSFLLPIHRSSLIIIIYVSCTFSWSITCILHKLTRIFLQPNKWLIIFLYEKNKKVCVALNNISWFMLYNYKRQTKLVVLCRQKGSLLLKYQFEWWFGRTWLDLWLFSAGHAGHFFRQGRAFRCDFGCRRQRTFGT